jgi:acyl carrier protein
MELSPGKLTKEITDVLRENLLVDVASAEEDLLASGALDSLTLVQLLVALEQRFSITIPLERLEIDDFRSITSIAHLVEQQMRASREIVHLEVSAAAEGRGGRTYSALAAPLADGGETQS